MKLVALASFILATASAIAADTAVITNEVSWKGTTANAEGKILGTITVETAETPDLADWGRSAGELCVAWYPKIIALLPGEDFKPRELVRLRFRKDMSGVAATSRNGISIAAKYVRGHTNDWGMVVHELTHVVQAYPEAEAGFVKPGWLVEGIADYIRLTHYEPQARRPRINPEKASYKDAYKTTAIFLEWAEKHHSKDGTLVRDLNQSLREGRFSLDRFKELTGKTVDELWQAFTESLRAK